MTLSKFSLKKTFLSLCFLLVTTTYSEPIRVACVGDSITFGYGIKDRDKMSYPAQLGKRLGNQYEVRNFGVNGHTLLNKGNAPYIKSNAYRDALAFEPQIVIIKLGTNDSKPMNWQYKSEFVTDYLALIQSFQKLKSQPQVFICKPVPVFPERWGITDTVVKETLPLIEQVSQKSKAPIIDLYTALTDKAELFPDKVHPNEAGATIMAETIATAISASSTNHTILQKKAHLLFIGDSITDMGRSRRPDGWDKNHLLGHSYVFNIAGKLNYEQPELNLKFSNRGISGNTVSDLRKRWQKDALELKPDVLTILIGANDLLKKQTVAKYEEDYRFILAQSRQANPKLKIVLFDPFVLPARGYKDPQTYKVARAKIDQFGAIVAKLANEFDATHIKTQQAFDAKLKDAPAEYWIWDGIHPLPQGHEVMARLWLEAINK
ncbi:putative O-antigen related protein [Lentisphaera araneosa HTCC2155]|jgi:lysophospholipase L1-like esterase|uniref:Putative O-antigen related protein n=1 Tax=Lentisphaera araneosa HTCC2155 TaxID=313628 RepID=A6DGF7_9BACT|nr:GDSL-type esterase/lipase family protein [Lentisphaera araneosa]EDM29274.1 putative O-antigen related protein [Lentisphaera araneosa HTCC2155]